MAEDKGWWEADSAPGEQEGLEEDEAEGVVPEKWRRVMIPIIVIIMLVDVLDGLGVLP